MSSEFDNLFFDALVRSYIEENSRFIRRDWLAMELDQKLQEPGRRFVLLTAEPGAGKSVFMAQLAHDHPNGCVTFYNVIACSDVGALRDLSFRG